MFNRNLNLAFNTILFLGLLIPSLCLSSSNKAPQRLSAWDIYNIDQGNITLQKNAHPYLLKAPLFTDYAWKWRAFILPNNKSIIANKEGEFIYPDGTLLVKTFFYPRSTKNSDTLSIRPQADQWIKTISTNEYKPIETRILSFKNNQWRAFVYIWNANVTEATLEQQGRRIKLKVTQQGKSKIMTFDYTVPSRQQCSECHGGFSEFNTFAPLGPSILQVHFPVINKAKTVVQTTHWASLGLLTHTNAINTVKTDPVREYLHINCAHCHNPTGTAKSSRLFLERDQTNMRHLGVCKRSVAAGRGAQGMSFDIVPSHPEESILLQRMKSIQADIKMPEVGRNLVDQEGVQLIEEWIQSMPSALGECHL